MTAPTIAVLDPDPAFLSLMHDLLTDAGYAPLLWQASAQRDPHALLRQVQPALLLLDLWLEARDDGWALLERLWGDAETAHIPVVLVTGEPHILPVRAALLHAMHCRVVRKPCDLQDLLDAMTAALGPSLVRQDRSPLHRQAITSAALTGSILRNGLHAVVAEDA